VLCTDPYIAEDGFVTLENAIDRADIIIFGAPHSMYQSIAIPVGKQIVDVWGFWQERRSALTTAAKAEHHAK